MRLTLCLEGNTEGRVLASIDMEEIVKMTITDDIEKSNFNPKMLKSATDLAYQCGYHQGRAEVIDSINDNIHEIYKCQFYCMEDMCEHDSPTVDMCIDCFYDAIQKSLEQLKEQDK